MKHLYIFLTVIFLSQLSFAEVIIAENGTENSTEIFIYQGQSSLATIDITTDSTAEVLKIFQTSTLVPDGTSEDCVKSLDNETCSLVFQITDNNIGVNYISILYRESNVTKKKRFILKVSSDTQSGDYSPAEMATAIKTSANGILDLGSVSYGDVFQRVYVQNTGSKNIAELAPVVVNGTGFSKGLDTCSNQPLDKGKSCSISVFFDSKVLFSDTYTGTLDIRLPGAPSGFSLDLEATATMLRNATKPHLDFTLNKLYEPEDCVQDPTITDKTSCFYEADPIDESAAVTSDVVCNETKMCLVNLTYQQPNTPVAFEIAVNFKDMTAPPEVVDYIPESGSLDITADYTDQFTTPLNSPKSISFNVTNNTGGGVAVPTPTITFNQSIFTLDASSTCPDTVLKLKDGESCTLVLTLIDVSQADKITDNVVISSGDTATNSPIDLLGYVLQPDSETKYDNKVYFDSGSTFQ